MNNDKKRILQNVVILQKALTEKDIQEKIALTKILNDNGIYCGADGLHERLERLGIAGEFKEIDRLLIHVLKDIIYLRG